MVQINLRNMKRIDKQRNKIHDKVHATYCVFEMDGEKYVQIDTYGRSTRKFPGSLSQSFQFDAETAAFLTKLLQDEFDL